MLDDLIQWFRDVRESPLKPVTTLKLVVALIFILLVFLVEITSLEGWVPVLDSLNLVFHEAGHPIFGIFGETIGFLGGTLGQLLVPLVVATACWQKREAVGIGLSGVWFFQNFLNIGRYMADARSQLLPLVGGGEHDWNTLFGMWGILPQDTAIAGTMKAIGWIGMLSCTAWLLWAWRRRDREPS